MNNKKFAATCKNENCVNLLELIAEHMSDYYDKTLTNREANEVFWDMCEQNKHFESIYDACARLAEEKGWEMI